MCTRNLTINEKMPSTANQDDVNFSDFFREAIRAKLAEVKVVKCRDIDYETAKKEIIGYFQRSGEAYSDEIAQDLELDFELVRQIEAELRREGRIEAI